MNKSKRKNVVDSGSGSPAERSPSPLRRVAGKRPKRVPTSSSRAGDSPENPDIKKLILDLRAHQAELEIQNEELIRVQVALEESRARYADLYDFAPVGFFTFDLLGIIQEANLTGAALLGVERRFLIKKPFSSFLAPGNADVFLRHRKLVFNSESREVCELEILPRKKPPFFVRMESIVSMRSRANSGRISSTISDITELVEARKELEKSRDLLEERVDERTAELKESNREMEAFSYSVSHDLRAPLRAIQGFASMIEKQYDGEMEGEILRKFQVIKDNAAMMGRLIDSLLDLSRLGRKDLHVEPIVMKKVIEEEAGKLREAMPAHQLKLELDSLPDAYGDKNLIGQVFQNLLSNAVKFGKDPGATYVRAGGRAKDNYYNLYYVQDSGIGFNMAYYDKLFGVFQRLHGTDHEGTGIGLAIVRRIVERHGGKIWAEGAENKGATFYFTLPSRPPAKSKTTA